MIGQRNLYASKKVGLQNCLEKLGKGVEFDSKELPFRGLEKDHGKENWIKFKKGSLC